MTYYLTYKYLSCTFSQFILFFFFFCEKRNNGAPSVDYILFCISSQKVPRRKVQKSKSVDYNYQLCIQSIQMNDVSLLFEREGLLPVYSFWRSTTRAAPLVMFPMAIFVSMFNTIENYSVICLKYACAVKNKNQLSFFW